LAGGLKSIQARYRRAYSVTTLPKITKNSQRLERDRSNSSPRQQLNLFTREPSPRRLSTKAYSAHTLPLEATYATPSACKGSGGHNWWNLRCGHNQKMFGGLYSAGERDQILRHFKGRREKIEPIEFGIVAERIIAATNLQRRAA
jgi:hypothetical protein